MSPSSIPEKAERLLAGGSVGELLPALTAQVLGDHGTYLVVLRLADGVASCDCQARGMCSHITAAMTKATMTFTVAPEPPA